MAEDKESSAYIYPDRTYILQFDGGARGNPGTAGAGMALFDTESGNEVWFGRRFIKYATCNEAEYTGLVTGLQCAISLGVLDIIVEGE